MPIDDPLLYTPFDEMATGGSWPPCIMPRRIPYDGPGPQSMLRLRLARECQWHVERTRYRGLLVRTPDYCYYRVTAAFYNRLLFTCGGGDREIDDPHMQREVLCLPLNVLY